MKKTRNFYQSEMLLDIAGLTHGVSGRHLGDMRVDTIREAFVKTLSVDPSTLTLVEQVHGGDIVEVAPQMVGKMLPGSDGLVTRGGAATLGVMIADCVPILLADEGAKVAAAVHAGWRGTVKNIVAAAVSKMKTMGAKEDSIRAFIGPHIGMCCYSVGEERVKQFTDIYGDDHRLASFSEGTWHLDIGYLNKRQLLNAGILERHIDAPIGCTSCQVSEFYSYRADSKESFGEQLAVIGFNSKP